MRHATSHAGLALLAYKIGPNQFELNRDLTYISMRDQVLRARTLIHAAFGAGIFEKKDESENSFADSEVDYDVVVLGAGVGGISTALFLVASGRH
jgi:heterodisulfide reductase subunit A-like polyferredoxin